MKDKHKIVDTFLAECAELREETTRTIDLELVQHLIKDLSTSKASLLEFQQRCLAVAFACRAMGAMEFWPTKIAEEASDKCESAARHAIGLALATQKNPSLFKLLTAKSK